MNVIIYTQQYWNTGCDNRNTYKGIYIYVYKYSHNAGTWTAHDNKCKHCTIGNIYIYVCITILVYDSNDTYSHVNDEIRGMLCSDSSAQWTGAGKWKSKIEGVLMSRHPHQVIAHIRGRRDKHKTKQKSWSWSYAMGWGKRWTHKHFATHCWILRLLYRYINHVTDTSGYI